MGAALSVSTAKSVQTAVNTTYQSAKNSCVTTCNQNMSGNVVVIDNSKVGDITFTQRCTADSSCYMKNAVDATVQTFQDQKTAAAAAPSLFPGIQVNITQADSTQTISNEITQILENICQADVNQNITNGIVYATDSTVGNIGFLQEGDASASCIMENSARLQLQMKQTGDTTSKTGAAATGIGGIIALVIVVLIIIFVLRALKKNTTQEPDTKSPEAQAALFNKQNQSISTQKAQPRKSSIMSKFGSARTGTGTGAKSTTSLIPKK